MGGDIQDTDEEAVRGEAAREVLTKDDAAGWE